MKLLTFLLVCALVAACRATSEDGTGGSPTSHALKLAPFGTTADGRQATLVTLENTGGVSVALTNFGAAVVALHVPDREGELADVVLGFDEVSGYEGEGNQYFGCTAGRVANRIAQARFELDGQVHVLPANDGTNHLHGGALGFGRRLWELQVLEPAGRPRQVHFLYQSPAGEEGYPGAVTAEVTYTLTDDDVLRIDYRATSTAATPVNLAHHSYFNLAGEGAPTVLDHELTIAASRYTPTDEGLIPTGDLAPVEDTPLDFRGPHRIGERIEALDDTPALGYDHNFVLDEADGSLRLAARLRHPGSGRAMEVWTTEPGLQFYSGNFLHGQAGKGGATYAHRSALCLEAQHYPDSVNHGGFPDTILRPGETYEQTTEYRFSAE